jgi:hypothetical protein
MENSFSERILIRAYAPTATFRITSSKKPFPVHVVTAKAGIHFFSHRGFFIYYIAYHIAIASLPKAGVAISSFSFPYVAPFDCFRDARHWEGEEFRTV